VKNADNIAVIDNGVVVEQGTHETLLAEKGTYSRMVAAQNLDHQYRVRSPPIHQLRENDSASPAIDYDC
jgi:ABC-type glutathione transport system ATPase component